MSLDINNTDKISIFQQELVRMNIKLIPPSINQSNSYFSREGEKISYALGAIKNVGIESMNDLVNERNSNGIFKNFSDLIKRCDTSIINKKTLEALACAGAFDEFKVNRSSVFNQAQEIVKFHKSQNNKSLSEQEDMFGDIELSHFTINEEEEWSYPYKLMKEYEMLGFYLTGHPLEAHKKNYPSLMLKEYLDIKENESAYSQKDVLLGGTLLSKKEKRSARGNAYAFLNFSDLSSIYELIVFESNLRKYRDLLVEGESFIISVDFSFQNGTLRGELKKVFSFDEVENLNLKKVKAENEEKANSLIKIYADGNFTKDELLKLKWVKGMQKVEIIYDNQLLKIPGAFEISADMIKEIKTLNGVKKIDLS